MSHPISFHALPRDVAALLARQRDDLEEIVPITGLAGKPLDDGATYRVRFRSGALAKARLWPPGGDIAYQRDALSRLPADRFPRILAVESRASLEQWFDGESLDRTGTTAGRLLESGRLLGLIHQTHAPGFDAAHRLRSTRECAHRLESRLHQLVSQGVIDESLATHVWNRATAHRPEHAVHGLSHRDFCAENLVVCRGSVCCIDNTTFATSALDQDLARTWYRWPMSGADWQLFLEGYGECRDGGSFLRHGLFWKAHVLTGAIVMRLRGGLPGHAEGVLHRLRTTFQPPDRAASPSARPES